MKNSLKCVHPVHTVETGRQTDMLANYFHRQMVNRYRLNEVITILLRVATQFRNVPVNSCNRRLLVYSLDQIVLGRGW